MPTVILLDVSLSMCRQASRGQGASNSITPDVNTDSSTIKQLARLGVEILCDYLSQNSQLEHVALVIFSSLYEIRHTFTRDYVTIKSTLSKLKTYDKSNVVNAVRGLLSMNLDEWSQDGELTIILITHGQVNDTAPDKSQSTEKSDAESEFRDIPLKELEGQFNFPCKLQVVCLASPQDPVLKLSLPFYKELINIVDKSSGIDCPVVTSRSDLGDCKRSAIWLPESSKLDVSREEVENLFSAIAELNYKPQNVTISCGHLSSMVMLCPKPTDRLVEPLKNEFDDLKNEETTTATKETFVSTLNRTRLYKLLDEINICGFIPLKDIASPAIISRHTVIPIANSKFNETAKAEQILSQDPNAYNNTMQTYLLNQEPQQQIMNSDNSKDISITKSKQGKQVTTRAQTSMSDQHSQEKDVTKQPSFCVLLHNCLKQENMVAVCIVGKNDETNEDWFGTLHSHTDTRKRSSLMLSLLLPGPSPILWLPNFRSLGSSMLNSDLPPAIQERLASGSSAISGGPGGAKSTLKSYSTNNVIWLDPESVQADVQKIVRHAKRTPDKAPHFYKELNRIRRAAISYGFYDVLYGLASILEREKSIMLGDPSKPANKEVIKHIDHVIACLRVNLTDDSFDTNILPPIS